MCVGNRILTSGSLNSLDLVLFLCPNNNSIVKITSNNKVVEKMCMKEKQKYQVTYFEVKTKVSRYSVLRRNESNMLQTKKVVLW